MKRQPTSVIPVNIPRKYCGTLNNTDGVIKVFNLALTNDNGRLLWLDMAGPANAVKSVWSRLVLAEKNERVAFYPDGRYGYAQILPPPGKKNKVRMFSQSLGDGLLHMILVSNELSSKPPSKDATEMFTMLRPGDGLSKRIEHIVDVPILPQIAAALDDMNTRALVPAKMQYHKSPLTVWGGLATTKEYTFVRISTDKTFWTSVICGLLRSGEVTF